VLFNKQFQPFSSLSKGSVAQATFSSMKTSSSILCIIHDFGSKISVLEVEFQEMSKIPLIVIAVDFD